MPWYKMIDLSDSDDDDDYNDDDDYENDDDLSCTFIFEKRSLTDIQKKWDKFYVDV